MGAGQRGRSEGAAPERLSQKGSHSQEEDRARPAYGCRCWILLSALEGPWEFLPVPWGEEVQPRSFLTLRLPVAL